MVSLADCLESLSGRRVEETWAQAVEIREAAHDSRVVRPGSLFVALPGSRRDGHDFAADAVAHGAVLLLLGRPVVGEGTVIDWRHPGPLPADRGAPYSVLVPHPLEALQEIARAHRARHAARVVGITGSTGKSSTKELVASVLGKRYRTIKSEGSLNNEIGLPLTLLRVRAEHERVVLEMGMYQRGEIRDLCRIARPTIGVVTNVGLSHAERAGSREDIAEAKSELVQSLPPDGVAVLNHDDPYVRSMAARTPARVLTYGTDPEADVWASEIVSLGLEGVGFRLNHDGSSLHVRIPLLGRHAVHNALAAATVGLAEDLSWAEIFAGLKDATAQLRLLVVQGLNGAILLDDTYNASPESSLAALNLLQELDGRRIAVLGDMLELGRYEEEGHRKVGRRAAEVCQLVVTVGSRAAIIAQEARAAGLPEESVHLLESNEQAIALLRRLLASGDFVLVKGSRAMRMEEIVAALAEGS